MNGLSKYMNERVPDMDFYPTPLSKIPLEKMERGENKYARMHTYTSYT